MPRATSSFAVEPVSQPNPLAALDLDRPETLTALTRDQFEEAATTFVVQGAALLDAIEQAAGLYAWAARHHLRDSEYGSWLHQFAEGLGRHEDTVTRWRDKVMREKGLAVPAITAARSEAKLSATRVTTTRVDSAARSLRSAPDVKETPAYRAAARALTSVPDDEPIEVVVGEIGPAHIRQAIALLLQTDVNVLAASATTAELAELKDLLVAARNHQEREAAAAKTREGLYARAEARRHPSRTGTT